MSPSASSGSTSTGTASSRILAKPKQAQVGRELAAMRHSMQWERQELLLEPMAQALCSQEHHCRHLGSLLGRRRFPPQALAHSGQALAQPQAGNKLALILNSRIRSHLETSIT
eukprot:CAMPEP_0185201510 /NCGR_PEP_ID=MMETSP1140-20130426/49343_1 /TAXON_ID=298111 /ORGANISM="Pavlova sp., Strain CCMP459" /LENGTH=112 /DNA_ID=CAMNT_0027768899 /DNA_START=21 /DNA_END=359 /DNA_ORIENTATION=+